MTVYILFRSDCITLYFDIPSTSYFQSFADKILLPLGKQTSRVEHRRFFLGGGESGGAHEHLVEQGHKLLALVFTVVAISHREGPSPSPSRNRTNVFFSLVRVL